jgi:hypothetical protein
MTFGFYMLSFIDAMEADFDGSWTAISEST